MNRLRALPVLTLLLLLGGASSANATVVLEVGLEEMTRASDLVFHGVVTRSDVVALEGNPTRLVTDVTFRMDTVLKGRALVQGDLLTIRLIGGRRGDFEVRIPGMPQFTAGDEVVLFLERTDAGFAITGLQQGRFQVDVDAETGERTVRRSVNGVAVGRFGAKGVFEMTEPPAAVDGIPLESLLQEIRLYEARGPLPKKAPEKGDPR